VSREEASEGRVRAVRTFSHLLFWRIHWPYGRPSGFPLWDAPPELGLAGGVPALPLFGHLLPASLRVVILDHSHKA
jgi:hypothetical protein